MAELRSGIFGTYYGSIMYTSSPLTIEQMRMNADYIYSYLSAQGWTKQAISGMLGNMQAESSINPGRWEGDQVNEGSGFGLVQWTPHSKYINWANDQGYSDYTEMDANLGRILYEVDNNIQWIATSSYPMSFESFTTSSEDVRTLAKAFLLNYERPADQSSSVQNYRADLSEAWYEYLGGNPNPPSPSNNKKKKGFNFILFNKIRRVL